LKRSVSVTIAGQRYDLRSDAEAAHVQRLAELVEERFRRAQRTSRQVATHKLAMLTALQLADELLAERARRAALRSEVRRRSRRMLQLLARGLEG
jgi:cell division protein ZapA (FtsZ GTPase activity inhibitor)